MMMMAVYTIKVWNNDHSPEMVLSLSLSLSLSLLHCLVSAMLDNTQDKHHILHAVVLDDVEHKVANH